MGYYKNYGYSLGHYLVGGNWLFPALGLKLEKMTEIHVSRHFHNSFDYGTKAVGNSFILDRPILELSFKWSIS